MYLLLRIFILIIFLTKINCLNKCESKEKCSDCIRQLDCVWCIRPNNNNTHCMDKSSLTKQACLDNVVDPKNNQQIVEDQNLRSETGNVVQIRPQKIKLRLRKDEEYKFNFQYQQAENYPVDLYYLMDLSASMDKHRQKLGQLGKRLADAMQAKTTDFKLGFGSFVDKVDLPFTSTVPSKLKSPCNFNGQPCAAPYSFKNHMNLTNDYLKFADEVSRARVSGNLDTPEGGLDALMQAIVCKKEIGWRPFARHLIVFSTDADFHIAGDGKLAGVIEPNDAKCHMFNNMYTEYLTYDYPSVSQINYVAKQNDINIVFAIVKSRSPAVLKSYELLSDRVENSNTGALDESSSNVIKLVLDNYNKIVNSVTMSTNSSDNVEVQIASNCQHPIANGCTEVHVGEVVNFTATIKALACPTDSGSSSSIITIKPEAVSENIIIELEVICDCECEHIGHADFEPNSSQCTDVGSLTCGICTCPKGRYGSQCECNEDASLRSNESNSNCIPPGKTAEDICSGVGTCKCGKCDCQYAKNSGKYCECDNNSCNRDHGSLCSDNGKCVCGTCVCNSGWTGPACECPGGNTTCTKQGQVCSGVGTCSCGSCDCKKGYLGAFCEECLTCPGRCEELLDCVKCYGFREGKYDRDTCDIKCSVGYSITTEVLTQDDSEEVKYCRSFGEKNCDIVYTYTLDPKKEFMVKIQKDKICPPNVLAWTLGVIGTILLAGLIMLIIWKILTSVYDRREFAKFENERKKLKWHTNDNPLFKTPTTTFKNPFYNRNSHVPSH